MQGVRRVDGGGIPDESSDESTWEGGGEMSAMENPGRGGRATAFLNDFPGQGSPAEMPGGGVPRPSGDEDRNAGALPAPVCPQHRGCSVGGKLPPPTVRPKRHDGPLSGPEWQAPCHSPVCQGIGSKEAAACGGGDEGELGAVL